jgi:hypothetical protein
MEPGVAKYYDIELTIAPRRRVVIRFVNHNIKIGFVPGGIFRCLFK